MTPAEIASLLVIQLIAASRLLSATKAAWGFIPPKYQWILPTVASALVELVAKLQTGVSSYVDLAVPIIVVVSSALPGARSNVHAALDGAVAKLANDPETTTISSSGYQRLTRGAATPGTAVMLPLLALALVLAGCTKQLDSTIATINTVTPVVASYVAEASNDLSLIEQAANLVFSRDPAAAAEFGKIDAEARRILSKLSVAADPKAVSEALAEFRDVYSRLRTFAENLNVFAAKPGMAPEPFPMPRAALPEGSK